MSLTRPLRDELCRVAVGPRQARIAETAALLRFGGAWTVRDGDAGWVLDTTVAGVLRRVRQALADLFDIRPTLEAHQPGGIARHARYRLRVDDRHALVELGLIARDGHPLARVPAPIRRGEPGPATGYLRGVLMAAGSLSAAGRAPHLEMRAPSAQAAKDLESLLTALGLIHMRAGAHGDGWRVVSKSGDDIGRILALVGAHGTFLTFDEGRLRRQLRGEATRAANADHANLGRAVTASARQVRMIERLIGDAAWDELTEDLREVALARLANPHASLTELAALVGTTRATIHRRLLRLEQEAGSRRLGWVASTSGDPPHSPPPSDSDLGRKNR